MELFIILIAIVVVVSLIMGIYSTNKHFKVKEQEIKLERERLELERKRLELEEKGLEKR
ncbi:cell division protein FtsL [Virgibacillus sp. YIM 98842]|uniref:cell division protein FtsL n=1 Tax=Virgibacillus sp. YIM 98842 TaxID=2663533 RepID=UPI0013DA677B|nr:cell division protein FtsL [Virgibacillus sp. YIM 98842]